MRPLFPDNPNTAPMLAEVSSHRENPSGDRPDVYSVVLAYSYDQETDPRNTRLVHQWAAEFPEYAQELLAVAYARTAMGWRLDLPMEEDF